MDIKAYLDDLEARIEPQEEEHLYRQWLDFYNGKFEGEVFSPSRSRKIPPRLTWPEIPINDAIENFELMALKELKKNSDALEQGKAQVLEIRANYGTCIIPSFFGVELFFMEREHETLPTNHPLPGGGKQIEKIISQGPPSLKQSYGTRVFEFGEYFRQLIAPYPKLKRRIGITHPDAQGPFDIVELLWGSSLFLDLYDRPDTVKALLEVVTETYIRFMNKWFALFPPQTPLNPHWGLLIEGKIMLRDDSAVNLSPEMFEEFIRPYDQRLLNEFGGGAIHYCGRGDHFIPEMGSMTGLTAVNLSQPHLNDMEEIFRNTVDRNIRIIALDPAAVSRARAAGRDLHGRVMSFD